MFLVGTFNLYNYEYHLVIKSLKSKSSWYLYSTVHPDDFIKSEEEQNKRLFNPSMLMSKSSDGCPEYCVEVLNFVFNKPVSSYGRLNTLLEIFDAYTKAKTYGYTQDEVLVDSIRNIGKPVVAKNNTEPSDKVKIKTEKEVSLSMQSSSGVSFSENRTDRMITYLAFSYGSINIDTIPYEYLKLPDFKYTNIEDTDSLKSTVVLDINKVSYENLKNMIDLSWFEDPQTGEIKKDYTHITSIIDFESKVMTPMIKEILRCKANGEKCLIGLDTETTGLMVKYLSDDNPIKDHIVSTQLSWKDDQGVNIYMDMAYFDNVNTDYVLTRLCDLFRWDHEEFDIELLYDENGNKISEFIHLDRNDYLLGGHNIPFDSQAFRSHGYEIFFDEDTLQMAFTIAPTSFKVKKGLKALTHKLLNVEAPELTDILGKGNEDKFRYLSDYRVADIYGCADVDMFRGVWKKLKALMDSVDSRLYKGYKRIDVYTLNVLAESEYYGLRLDESYIKKEADHMEADLRTIEETIYQCVGKMLLMKASHALNKPFTKEEFDQATYRFKITGKDLLNVTYKYLEYPVKVLTDKGEPALNSYAMDKLLFYKNAQPSNFLTHDIMSASSTEKDPKVLLSAEKFNSYKYPLCYLLQEYRTLSKEYTGYYKPFKEIDTEGRLFRGYKMSNIETRRISNPAQTIKKNLKKCVLAHGDDWNLGDWDLAQIELRMFTSLAKDEVLINKMLDGDTDFHTENGAIIFDVPPHLLPKSDRSKAKTVGFGVPYGLSPRALCEWMFTVVNQKNMLATNEVLDIYERKNHLSMDLLKSYRAKANVDAYMSPELRDFLEIPQDAPVSVVHNLNGFYRYQDMSNIRGDSGKTASVERAFGNFPIQSFAADYFKMLIGRLDRRLRKEGYKDKFILHMTIHDEILFSFHKSFDPNLLAKFIKEECMLRIKGHTNYFLGLNFGKNWYECKADEAELPVKFLLRNCKAFDSDLIPTVDWCDDPAAYFAPKVFEFKKDRIIECLSLYEPEFKQCINFDTLFDKFENYTVRSYFYNMPCSYEPRTIMENGKPKLDKKGKEIKDSDDIALSALMFVLAERGYTDGDIISKGKRYKFTEYLEYRNNMVDNSIELDEIDIDLSLDAESDIEDLVNAEDNFWSFDDSENAGDMFFYVEDEFDEFKEKVDDLLTLHSDNYKYIENVGATKILIVDSYRLAEKLEQLLFKYKDPNGTRVILDYGGTTHTAPIKYNLPKDSELEAMIAVLHKDSLAHSSVF